MFPDLRPLWQHFRPIFLPKLVSIIDTFYAMMFYGNYNYCVLVSCLGVYSPFPRLPSCIWHPRLHLSQPTFLSFIYTCIGPLLFYTLLFLFCYCSLCMLHSLPILASYTQALKGCMFMRLQAGIFTLRTCARVGLSVYHCHCCRCRHENIKISRCRHLSELQVQSSCQMQQKDWLKFASNRLGPGSPQILHFVLTTTINHTYGWPWLVSAHAHNYNSGK